MNVICFELFRNELIYILTQIKIKNTKHYFFNTKNWIIIIASLISNNADETMKREYQQIKLINILILLMLMNIFKTM